MKYIFIFSIIILILFNINYIKYKLINSIKINVNLLINALSLIYFLNLRYKMLDNIILYNNIYNNYINYINIGLIVSFILILFNYFIINKIRIANK